jgi:hypothetical protein
MAPKRRYISHVSVSGATVERAIPDDQKAIEIVKAKKTLFAESLLLFCRVNIPVDKTMVNTPKNNKEKSQEPGISFPPSV